LSRTKKNVPIQEYECPDSEYECPDSKIKISESQPYIRARARAPETRLNKYLTSVIINNKQAEKIAC
jgi:hypothetical protein